MYEPRNPRLRRPLKKRSAKYVSAPLTPKTFWTNIGWLSLVTLGSIVVPPRVVPRIYTFIKKLIRYPRTRARFWVNAQCAYLITRKPLNVRMGKGKGARIRPYTFLRDSSTLASVSCLRTGFKRRLRRFISIRLGRPVLLFSPLAVAPKVEWAQYHRTQVNFLRARAYEIKALLVYIRRPTLKFFFSRLFKAAWRKPRLRWRFNWPLLPRISARAKVRKKRWGAGARYSSPVWAGLASLLNGVRRTRSSSPLAKFAKKRGRRVMADLAIKNPNVRRTSRVFLNFRRSCVLSKLVYVGFIKSKLLSPFGRLRFPLAHTAHSLQRVLTSLDLKLLTVNNSNPGLTPLPTLLQGVVFLEKTGLLLAAGLASRPTGFYIEGLQGLKSTSLATSAETEETSSDNNVVTLYIAQGGFADTWPALKLEPLLLTCAALVPRLR